MSKYLNRNRRGRKLTATHQDFKQWLVQKDACYFGRDLVTAGKLTFAQAWRIARPTYRDWLAANLYRDCAITYKQMRAVHLANGRADQVAAIDPDSIGFLTLD